MNEDPLTAVMRLVGVCGRGLASPHTSDRALAGRVRAQEWEDALRAVGELRVWLDETELVLVAGARREGWPWSQVAGLLGRARQSVSEKYRAIG